MNKHPHVQRYLPGFFPDSLKWRISIIFLQMQRWREEAGRCVRSDGPACYFLTNSDARLGRVQGLQSSLSYSYGRCWQQYNTLFHLQALQRSEEMRGEVG